MTVHKQVTPNKTKIVATVGPACNTKEKLLELMIAGADVFRLNFSHGTHEQHASVIKSIRELNDKFGFNVSILQDLQGPKIRLRDVENGGIQFEKGEQVVIAYEKQIGTKERLTSTYDLAQDVRPGEALLIDDGTIELRITGVEGVEVHAEVIHGGLFKPRKGINLPDTNVSAPSLTAKDREDLEFGLQNNVDWIALSFVRTEADIMELRNIILEQGSKSKIIAKIETPTSLKNIDKIIEATDGLMVARGDLGVEIPMEEVPLVQKMLVRKCNEAFKPVIIATQMLESMISLPRPTRAEANDVANAVIDGADAVMLSAETASGNFPVEAIQTMERIIGNIERNHDAVYNKAPKLDNESPHFLSRMLVAHACQVGQETGAKAIVGMTRSGYTAMHIAGQRPQANIYVFTRSAKVMSRLNLIWGVRCFMYDKTANSIEETYQEIEKILLDTGCLTRGDVYISIRSKHSDDKKSANVLKINKVD